MTWKINRDRFYRSVYPFLGRAGIEEAGFFIDSATRHESLDDVNWLCTPLTKINRYKQTGRPAVIVMTGSMCPVHTGHIELMEAARDAAEAAGFTIIGGYLSPGHDEYTASKTGIGNIPASTRVALCAEALSTSDWIDVDPWEALHRKVAVNFTDVVERLGRYLTHHIGYNVEVIYACGADNARFALTFAKLGHCIVVGRPDYEDRVAKYQAHPLLQGNPNVMWAHGSNSASSTAVRNGDMSMVPPSIRRRLNEDTTPIGLVLRTEGVESLGHWRQSRSDSLPYLQGKVLKFQETIEGLFIAAFEGRVKSVSLAAQLARTATLWEGKEVISLDPMLPATHNLAMSRVFGMGGYRQEGFVNRPGSPALENQAECIPPGSYTIFDDDIVTGGTVACARELLLDFDREVVGHISLETSSGGADEVADCRDFLLGANEAGLVIDLPDGSQGRALYALPFVDPTVRSSIPPKQALDFSIQVWRANVEFFNGTGLSVSDLPAASRRTMLTAGHFMCTRLVAVCQTYVDRLTAQVEFVQDQRAA